MRKAATFLPLLFTVLFRSLRQIAPQNSALLSFCLCLAANIVLSKLLWEIHLHGLKFIPIKNNPRLQRPSHNRGFCYSSILHNIKRLSYYQYNSLFVFNRDIFKVLPSHLIFSRDIFIVLPSHLIFTCIISDKTDIVNTYFSTFLIISNINCVQILTPI